MPHLRLADVQRLGQTCRAARALVNGFPEAALRQLAEVRATRAQTAQVACAHD